MCEVRTSGPRTFAKRRTLTVVSGLRSANAVSDASASPMSRSIGGARRMRAAHGLVEEGGVVLLAAVEVRR